MVQKDHTPVKPKQPVQVQVTKRFGQRYNKKPAQNNDACIDYNLQSDTLPLDAKLSQPLAHLEQGKGSRGGTFLRADKSFQELYVGNKALPKVSIPRNLPNTRSHCLLKAKDNNGDYLKPKVLDFQPGLFKVDPLSTKRPNTLT